MSKHRSRVILAAGSPCQLAYPGVNGWSDKFCEICGSKLASFIDDKELCLECLEKKINFDTEAVESYRFLDTILSSSQVYCNYWRGRVHTAAGSSNRATDIMAHRHLVLAAERTGEEVVDLRNKVMTGCHAAVLATIYPDADIALLLV